jgi:predicted lipoprotein with Yx(FWY)xxD motif
MKKLILLLAMCFAGVAMAQNAPAFEEVDIDADGQITKEEAMVVEGLDFATCDEDQDGVLSKEEYEACALAE